MTNKKEMENKQMESHDVDVLPVLARKKQVLVPCVYHFYKHPPVFVRGEGLYLYDSTGKAYLDFFSGVSVNHLGHCHPAITEAICRQANTLCHTTTIYLTEPMIELAELLVSIAPVKDGKVFFCASGSEANETAAMITQNYTGRGGYIALENSLHGNSKLTLSLTGVDFWKTDQTPISAVVHGPAPYCFRCPFDQKEESCSLECADALEKIISSARIPVGTFFLEIVQANGGIVVPPPKWFQRLKEILSRHQLLLVVDEVQTAFGRTGRMFASDHFDLQPDVVTVAKSIGGGLPMGAAITSGSLAERFTHPRASTFGGNPVVAKAGSAVLDTIRKEDLVTHAALMGERLKTGLHQLQKKYAIIGDVRGLGLMIGVELVGADKEPATDETDTILEEMKDSGFILGKGGQGRNVLVFMPPLIIDSDGIDATLMTLDTILTKLGF
jgi:4-aminobutyrate aminotransferase-like enzyme